MPTTEELVIKFEKFSDEELLQMHNRSSEYTAEGLEAIAILIKERGGLESVSAKVQQELDVIEEKRRLSKGLNILIQSKSSEKEIKEYLKTDLLSEKEIKEVLVDTNAKIEDKKQDLTISLNTILGSAIGAFLGGTISGIILGVTLIYSGKIFYIFLIGMGILPYMFINIFTKQTYKNVIVITFVLLSIVYAYFLGSYILAVYK